MIQDWWTLREAAEAKLPGIPGSERGVHALSDRESWSANPTLARKRAGRGGGWEYHRSLFPEAAQMELALRAASAASAALPVAAGPVSVPAPAPKPVTRPALSPDRLTLVQTQGGDARATAKLRVLSSWDAFFAAKGGQLGKEKAAHLFAGLWNSGGIEAPAEVREAQPTISRAGLYRWLAARANGELDRLAGRYGGRKGTGRWDNELRAVRDFVIGTLAARPHLSVVQLRQEAQGVFCFGDVDDAVFVTDAAGQSLELTLPPIGAFHELVRRWKDDNPGLFERIENPGKWHNRRMLAVGDDVSHITELNQLWLVDASPQDVLTVEGRYSIYLIIDVWSRRILVMVTKTPRTEAMKLLLRRALLLWGVPRWLKTDNGSDFVSREALRVFLALGIEHEAATAYCPWEKGMVERAIGTLQHLCFRLFPGYCGHNVAAAQALRERKKFADRLGESDKAAFSVQLTADQVQRLVDAWVEEKYSHRKHTGTGMGVSPAVKVASWTGDVRQIADRRALDLLLMRVEGTRMMGKKGLRYKNRFFYAKDHSLVAPADRNEPLEIRIDPDDPNRLYVWSTETLEFIGVAEATDEMPPEELAALACEGRAKQIKGLSAERAALKKLGGQADALTGLMTQLGDSFQRNRSGKVVAMPPQAPPQLVTHTSPELEAAGRAMRARDKAPRELTAAETATQAAIVVELSAPQRARETPDERFARAIGLEALIAAGESVDPTQAHWFAGYQNGAEYRARARMAEDFKDFWEHSAAG